LIDRDRRWTSANTKSHRSKSQKNEFSVHEDYDFELFKKYTTYLVPGYQMLAELSKCKDCHFGHGSGAMSKVELFKLIIVRHLWDTRYVGGVIL